MRSPHRSLALLLVLAALGVPLDASAQDRSRSGRARLELSLDHGYGASSEGGYGEIAADLRLSAPSGLGAVLRTGLATQLFSNALGVDLGVAYRIDLASADHVGVQLGGALGPSLSYGPFDGGWVLAYGGWAMLHLDLWFRNFLVGVGVSAHAMASERHEQDGGRADPILTLAPMVRIGGDWGL